jgi:undecaprenyl diphosphate synthase
MGSYGRVIDIVGQFIEIVSHRLYLYGFSSENWKRPAAEIDDLMGLLRLYLVNAESQAWQTISTF